jgi:hypothetical protein
VIHAGLGSATKVDRLEVLWPNGQKEDFPVDKLNMRLILKQGAGVKK